ncbi:MAG: hypothetical protein K0R85_932 [Devosia sp.]|jgi:hypothetical protein|nr:hypothetical protein [Devosia sp.]
MIPPSYLFKSIYFDAWERPAPVTPATPPTGGGDGWRRWTLTGLGTTLRRLAGPRAKAPLPANCVHGPAFGH